MLFIRESAEPRSGSHRGARRTRPRPAWPSHACLRAYIRHGSRPWTCRHDFLGGALNSSSDLHSHDDGVKHEDRTEQQRRMVSTARRCTRRACCRPIELQSTHFRCLEPRQPSKSSHNKQLIHAVVSRARGRCAGNVPTACARLYEAPPKLYAQNRHYWQP